MTLAAVWLVEERMYAIADTRISRERGHVLTEHGPKILPLNIVCKQPGPSGFIDRVVLRSTLGFAYAGSTLSALSTHALANTLCSNLGGRDGAPPPSILQVAYSVAEIGYRYMREVGELSGASSLFSAIVFGFCPAAQDFKAFYFAPRIAENKLKVDIEEFQLKQPESILVIGSRPQLLKDRIQSRRPNFFSDAGDDPKLVKLREIDLPRRALEELISEGADDSFGGAIQFAWVSRFGFEPVAHMIPITPAPPSTRNAALTVLGFDMFDFAQVGHYIFNLSGR